VSMGGGPPPPPPDSQEEPNGWLGLNANQL
jgi:hypothetical protein